MEESDATSHPSKEQLPTQLQTRIRIDAETGCWLWRVRPNSDGYGSASWQGRRRAAHRLIYELLIGPIPEALVLDHLCRVRCCVNPAHLEPVTVAENSRRVTAHLRDGPAPTYAERNRQRRLDPAYQYRERERELRRIATGKRRKARPGPGQGSIFG